MGIITISLEDNIEALIRRKASEKHGNKKGAIKEVLTEAILALDKTQSGDQEKIAARQMALMKKGFKIGYKPMSRSELWDRT